MWLRRLKTVTVASSSPKFAFTSFKDVQQLCQEDNKSPHPNKPIVLHRVFCTPSLDSPRLHATKSLDRSVSYNRNGSIHLPGSEKRVVLYFTSLRVVRPTFEQCHAVRTILRGFRVTLDERDVSMDSKFIVELRDILGLKKEGKDLTLPRVFIGGRYIGGADEVKHLHETGELKKFIERLPVTEPGVCEVCGGYRFILCGECSGSRKCHSEKGGFRTCTVCNENGLIRCPSCL